MKKFLVPVLLVGLAACSRKQIHTPAVPAINSGPPDYEDLRPGEMLRVVIPLLKSAGARPMLQSEEMEGATISFSASDLVGYQTVHYAINARRGGRVQLSFESAELTKNGASTLIPEPAALPFPLPRKAEVIRLIYLQRLSNSDHNMAIAASRRKDDLNTLTMQIRKDPKACMTTKEVSCYWVPAGVAVRPEETVRK